MRIKSENRRWDILYILIWGKFEMSYMKVIRLGSLCITSSGYKEAEDQNCGSWLWISNVNPAHPLAIPALIVKMRQQTSGVKQTKKQESSSCFQTLLHPEAFFSSRPFKAQEDVNCQGSLGIYCTVRQERRSKETTHGIHLMQRGWTVHVSCLGGSVCCFSRDFAYS